MWLRGSCRSCCCVKTGSLVSVRACYRNVNSCWVVWRDIQKPSKVVISLTNMYMHSHACSPHKDIHGVTVHSFDYYQTAGSNLWMCSILQTDKVNTWPFCNEGCRCLCVWLSKSLYLYSTIKKQSRHKVLHRGSNA